MNHLYEAVFESPSMWLKIQVSSKSRDGAIAHLGYCFGDKMLDPVTNRHSLSVPFRLSERSRNIENWEVIRDHLPDGWDDHEFRIVGDPYPWCETLSDDCDCYGTDGRLNVAYCSDLGGYEDTLRREGKSLNVRRYGWRQVMESGDAEVERYAEEHLKPYRAAIYQMVKSSQDLEQDQTPDHLYLVIKVQRDLTDPTGNSHRMTISRYPNWGICLGIIDGLLDVDTG